MSLGTRQNHSSGDNAISMPFPILQIRKQAPKDEESCLKSHGRSVVKQAVEALLCMLAPLTQACFLSATGARAQNPGSWMTNASLG